MDTRRPFWVDALILILAGGLFAAMIGLGNWQMHRLAWKLDLIEQVQTLAFGDPVPAPTAADAPEYLRVQARGEFDHSAAIRIKAVTEVGAGFWVMTPLQTADQTIWINRGFVPSGLNADDWTQPGGQVQVTGLVRADQPGGTLLESNKPGENRWVSADLTVMSNAANIGNAQLGYFIDDEADGGADVWPRGGLTRLEFRNSHLAYAITWYAMALMFFAAIVGVIWSRIKGRRIDA
ncbi:SURF1 family protein [Loktanella salsilacus]|uniref:SURF1 family protein n=1 Tax=Loktanella salsilacus TaxID=195913 RepID=UPI0037358B67